MTILRKIYRKHGIKMKVIQYKKVISPTLRSKLPALRAQLKQEIDQARAEGHKVIFIDETMFTRKAINRVEWSKRN